MQIVIPMSGSGQRFRDAGYQAIKPLIEVDGKPIIEHVVSMFPGEENFIFICNEDHLSAYPLAETLKRIAPTGRIVPIKPHKKGPVYAVAQVADQLERNNPVIVNYCDFYTDWDYDGLKRMASEHGAAGAVAAYKGFHPHMLGTDNYAFIRDSGQWLEAIQEKKPFTSDRMSEYASSGTYYFSRGEYVQKYFQQLMSEGAEINGEYYVSMIYNLMVRDRLPVLVYEIQHMLQWGTPGDLAVYQRWSDYFKDAITPQVEPLPEQQSLTLLPMAGEGRRFAERGYQDPKPLIPVSGLPMVVQATRSLPPSASYAYVAQKSHLEAYPIETTIHRYYPQARMVGILGLTEGQACTCALGLTDDDLDHPLFVGACDNGLRYNAGAFAALREDSGVDAIVLTFRHHPGAAKNPQMYGWVKTDAANRALAVSVKKPISKTPFEDHAIVGAFYFKKARYLMDALNALVEKNIRVNGEFYVDSCMGELIDQGRHVSVFEVDHYLCWGTPDEYRTFVYWQSFFHKCPWHPYTLAKDATVPGDQVTILDREYRDFRQPQPCPFAQTHGN